MDLKHLSLADLLLPCINTNLGSTILGPPGLCLGIGGSALLIDHS